MVATQDYNDLKTTEKTLQWRMNRAGWQRAAGALQVEEFKRNVLIYRYVYNTTAALRIVIRLIVGGGGGAQY
jgi:hypothetical protein